jgi:superfamily II RNA helicase
MVEMKKKAIPEKRVEREVKSGEARVSRKSSKKKKKTITKKQFERVVQVCSIVVPLVVAIIGSATSIAAAYISHPPAPKPEIHYSLSVQDQKDLNELRSQFKQAERELSNTSTPAVKDELDRRLRGIALQEAKIMQKYDPEFQPRYPLPVAPVMVESAFILPPTFLVPLVLVFVVLSYFWARGTARSFLRRNYEIEPTASS